MGDQRRRQHLPEIRDNPKFQNIMDDVKANGPMSMLRYMNDPEVMTTMTKLASSLFSRAPARALLHSPLQAYRRRIV